MNKEKVSEVLKKTISLINKLRGDSGCPWVKNQNFIRQFDELKSEIEEVERAINNGDIDNLKEELGDIFWDTLLLIKVFEEEHECKFEDILENTCQKIIRRKPYVFGNEKAETIEEALAIWNRVKEEEKKKL